MWECARISLLCKLIVTKTHPNIFFPEVLLMLCKFTAHPSDSKIILYLLLVNRMHLR